MARGRQLLLLAASASLAACADGTGPRSRETTPEAAGRELHVARWLTDGPPRFRVSHQATGDRQDPLPQAAQAGLAPVPETDSLSFWAYQDRDQSVLVRYLAADESWQPYVELVIPNGSLLQYPDGTLFSAGDSVLIGLAIDSTELLVHLEPTGLVFNPLIPAQFTMWYTGADPDFNGDGVVDDLDAAIEETLLGLWVQVNPEDPWEAVVATHSLLDKLFSALLQHFSGYAVSW